MWELPGTPRDCAREKERQSGKKLVHHECGIFEGTQLPLQCISAQEATGTAPTLCVLALHDVSQCHADFYSTNNEKIAHFTPPQLRPELERGQVRAYTSSPFHIGTVTDELEAGNGGGGEEIVQEHGTAEMRR